MAAPVHEGRIDMPQNATARNEQHDERAQLEPQSENLTRDGRPMTPAEIILERHARGAWYEWT